MNINFKKLYRLLLPSFLRQPLIWSFLQPVFNRLSDIFEDYKKYAAEKRYELEVTPQVWSLEKMLNERFCNDTGSISEYITITEAERLPAPYFFNAGDEKRYFFVAEGIPPIHFFWTANGEYNIFFIVNVPSRLHNPDDEAQIKALLNKYKLVSKTFKINYNGEQ